MPIIDEDEEKLDVALAIAAQARATGGRWTAKEVQPPPPSSRDQVQRRIRPPPPPSFESSPVGQRTNGVRNRGQQMLILEHGRRCYDDRMVGKFTRSPVQTAPIDYTGEGGGGGVLTTTASVDASCVNQLLSLVKSSEYETAFANETEKSMVTDSDSLFFLPLTLLSPSGTFIHQSNNSQSESLDTLIDPQLMQVLMQEQQQRLIISDDVNCLTSTSQLNPSISDQSKVEKLNSTSSDLKLQLPGSLNTLRDYYINASHASEAFNNNVPSSTPISVESNVIPTSNTQQNVVFTVIKEANECVSSALDNKNNEMNLSLPRGAYVRSTRPKIVPRNCSVSAMNSRDSNSSDSCTLQMPGSLSILQKYYRDDVVTSVSGNSNDHWLTFNNSNANISATMSDETVLNLSKEHFSNDHKEKSMISDVGDCDLMLLAIQGNQAIHLMGSGLETLSKSHSQTGIRKTMSLPVKSLAQTADCFSSSEGLNFKSQISLSPVRILPEVKESSELSLSSVHLGKSHHHLVQQADSDINRSESFTCPSILPLKKQKTSNISQLDTLRVLMGEEENVSPQEFISQLNGNAHQSQTSDPGQSENLYNQSMSSMSYSPSSISPSLLTSLVPASGIHLVVNQQDSVLNFSTDNLNRRRLVFDREPEICATTIMDCISSADVSLKTDANNITVNTCFPSKHVKKRPILDHHRNEKLRLETASLQSSDKRSHPILQPDEDGDLPLHIAVVHGKEDFVRHLTQMMNQLNTTIDCRNYLKQTPLHLGVVMGDCVIVDILLGAGASPNIADRNGQNCFHLAVQHKRTKCLQHLFTFCSACQPDVMNYDGMTALHLAVKLNQTDSMVVLLNNGAQLDLVDGKSGHTPLYMAADGNRLKAAEILLSSGADAQIASYSGCSPVQAAAAKSFHEMVGLLTKHGAMSEQISSNKFCD